MRQTFHKVLKLSILSCLFVTSAQAGLQTRGSIDKTFIAPAITIPPIETVSQPIIQPLTQPVQLLAAPVPLSPQPTSNQVVIQDAPVSTYEDLPLVDQSFFSDTIPQMDYVSAPISDEPMSNELSETSSQTPQKITKPQTKTRKPKIRKRKKVKKAGGVRSGVKVAIPRGKPVMPPGPEDYVTDKLIAALPKYELGCALLGCRSDTLDKTGTKPTPKPEPNDKSSETPDDKPKEAVTQDNVQERLVPTAPIKKEKKPFSLSILFDEKAVSINESVKTSLSALAVEMKRDEDMQILLASYATGTAARRTSLTRALQIRSKLIADGIDADRILVKTHANGKSPEKPHLVELSVLN